MSVKVRRERPDQRRHHRVTAPMFVSIGGVRYRADNWSLGGLKVSGLKCDVPSPGDKVSLHLELPFQGFGINFDVTAEVVRNAPDDGMIAVKFLDLGEREAELMQHFIEDIIRGAMSDVEDTIQRIDVPVTPASIKPDPSPKEQVPKRRWPVRAVVMSAAYLFAGLAVFGYAGVLVYSSYIKLEIRSAVISAPLENVKAQAEGRVKWTKFRPGDPVQKGDIVLQLDDNKIEREIDLARLAIKERSNEVAYFMRRKIDEIEKVSAFAEIEAKDIEQARLLKENLEEQVHAARLAHVRAEHLYAKRHTPATKVEDARKRLVELEKRLESEKLELETRIRLAEKNIGKRHYNGEILVGDLQKFNAEIKRAEGLLDLDKQRFEVALLHRRRLNVMAPFTGTLLQLPRTDNGYVKAGETVALFEKSGVRAITAFLTQDEISDIQLGALADVYIPATGEFTKAQISDIDRTTGFFRQATTRSAIRHQWRGSKERTARVKLQFTDPQHFSNHVTYRSGLPVTVNFTRKGSSYINAQVQYIVAQLLSFSIDSRDIAERADQLWRSYHLGADHITKKVHEFLGRPRDVQRSSLDADDDASRLEAIANGFRLPGPASEDEERVYEAGSKPETAPLVPPRPILVLQPEL